MKKYNYPRPDYETIINAVEKNDNEAIERIVMIYHRYICAYAQRTITLQNGKKIDVLDEELKEALETKLRKAILKFKVK